MENGAGNFTKEAILSLAKCGKKILAPMIFNGTCHTKSFEAWVKKFLIKELKAGQTVILDNATFHKSERTKNLIESAGCELLFLPPYSPELNPIEKLWANLKRWIKKYFPVMQDTYFAIQLFFTILNS